MMNEPTEFRYYWWFKASPMRVVDRRGQSCRILARAPVMNSVLVEFLDGFKVVTSRHAVRTRWERRDI